MIAALIYATRAAAKMILTQSKIRRDKSLLFSKDITLNLYRLLVLTSNSSTVQTVTLVLSLSSPTIQIVKMKMQKKKKETILTTQLYLIIKIQT